MLDDPRLPAEIRGRYRIWRSDIACQAPRIEALLEDRHATGKLHGRLNMCKGIGRDRALRRLRALYEGAGARFIGADAHAARWAYLVVQHNDIIVVLLTIAKDDCGGFPWAFSATDHALMRVLQRCPGADLTEMMWTGLAGARRLNVETLTTKYSLSRFRVEAGDGAFSCELYRSLHRSGNFAPSVRARTWLPRETMNEVQEAQILDEGHPGITFDDIYRRYRENTRVAPRLMYLGDPDPPGRSV